MTSRTPDISPTADENLIHRFSITAFYEDLPTGIRAKRFIDELLRLAGDPLEEDPHFWRLALADSRERNAEMLENAKASEFVILSVRGDEGLTREARNLLQEWAVKSIGRQRSVVLLFDPFHLDAQIAFRMRRYVRVLADQYGIAFFGHLFTPAAATDPGLSEAAIEDANEESQYRCAI